MSLPWLIFSQISASGSSSKNSGMLTPILIGIFRVVFQVIENVFFRIGVFQPDNASAFLPGKDDKMLMWQKEINFETHPSSMLLCAIRPRPDQRARNIPPKKKRKTSIARFSFTTRRARHPHQIWSSSSYQLGRITWHQFLFKSFSIPLLDFTADFQVWQSKSDNIFPSKTTIFELSKDSSRPTASLN